MICTIPHSTKTLWPHAFSNFHNLFTSWTKFWRESRLLCKIYSQSIKTCQNMYLEITKNRQQLSFTFCTETWTFIALLIKYRNKFPTATDLSYNEFEQLDMVLSRLGDFGGSKLLACKSTWIAPTTYSKQTIEWLYVCLHEFIPAQSTWFAPHCRLFYTHKKHYLKTTIQCKSYNCVLDVTLLLALEKSSHYCHSVHEKQYSKVKRGRKERPQPNAGHCFT